MTRDQLLVSASQLVPPTSQAAREYAQKQVILAEAVSRTLEARADLESLIGPNNGDMMRDNHKNHGLFMTSLFCDWSPTVLVDTVLWVFRAYRAHGFRLTYWPAQLNAWLAELPNHLTPEAFHSVAQVYRWILVHQPDFTALSEAGSEAPSSNDIAHGSR